MRCVHDIFILQQRILLCEAKLLIDYVTVAQWIEHPPPERGTAGPIPASDVFYVVGRESSACGTLFSITGNSSVM